MKIFLLIGVALLGSALAQNSAAPTKQPKPTKPPKAGPVVTCSNITRYEPRSCCPSFPKIDNKETIKCGRQCANKNDSHICCVSNCTLNEIKGFNVDGSFNVKALTDFFAKYSNLKNKTGYTSLVADIVQKCVAGLSGKACPPAEVAFCTYRQLFIQCPDMKNSTICKSVKDAVPTCPSYPLIGENEKPKSSKNDAKQADSKKENGKKNDEKKPNEKKENGKKNNDKKNDGKGSNVPKGKDKTTANPAAINGTTPSNNASVEPNKAQKGKAKEIKFPQTTQKPTTAVSGNNTTHKSESRDGALGPQGPGFQP